jgi:hypothetical protein
LIAASDSAWLPVALAALSAVLMVTELVDGAFWLAAVWAVATLFWLRRARAAGSPVKGSPAP